MILFYNKLPVLTTQPPRASADAMPPFGPLALVTPQNNAPIYSWKIAARCPTVRRGPTVKSNGGRLASSNERLCRVHALSHYHALLAH